ncbi:MAG: hypothetical protein ACRDTH_08275 [Pseudonocardiaceae bacterium]
MDHTPQDRQIPGEPSPPGFLAGGSGVRQLRWARCPDDGRLHLLVPVEVVVAATGGQAEALCGRALPAEGLTLASGSSGPVCTACVDGIPWPSNDSGSEGSSVGFPVPDQLLISAEAAARVLQEHFLANADRGDHAANDELVTEILRRIRTRRASGEGGC